MIILKSLKNKTLKFFKRGSKILFDTVEYCNFLFMLQRVKRWPKLIILICCTILSTASLSSAQTFPCDGGVLLSSHQGAAPTVLYKVFFGPFNSIGYPIISIYRDGAYDALGFNPRDNYIYAVKQNTNEIYRLTRDGTTELLGAVDVTDTLKVGAGACTPEGKFMIYDNELHELLFFDVMNGFSLTERLSLRWNESSRNTGPFNTRIEDIAIDPTNPTVAYIHQADDTSPEFGPTATLGFLHSVNLNPDDPEYGSVSSEALLTPGVVEQIGGLVFGSAGELYGYGGGTRRFSFFQDQLLSINKINGETTMVGVGAPISTVTDGCSCPYNLSFTNTVNPQDVLCTNTEVTFDLRVINRFFDDIVDAEMNTSMPSGMLITEITGNLGGSTINPGTGVGTDTFSLSGLTVPANGSIEIQITADVIDIEIELIENQVLLTNLPERMGGFMVSDDPRTVGSPSDSTAFYGTPQQLSNIEIDINHPSECIDPTDGTVMISAPELIVGNSYEVTLRNEDYEMISWRVDIDDSNSFELDTVLPGQYDIFQIKPITSNCSFAMRDTSIDVEGPDEVIQLEVSSNGPVCEGTPLRLSGFGTPSDEIEWTGPLGYWSIENTPTINNPQDDQAGSYVFTASYGVCERTDSVNVFVAPAINGKLMGDDVYCARDSILLRATGEGENLNYNWLSPIGDRYTDSTLSIARSITAQTGDFRLIIDNNVCADTLYKQVTVNPSPTIVLDQSIITDYCDPLSLEPIITNDINAVYQWTPSDGLSCDDCPDPDVGFPLQKKYELQVQNEYNCRDSAQVELGLIKENLIYIPNAFSPNGDGINDRFELSPGCGIAQINNIKVSDRWGAIVYESGIIDNYEFERFWDGSVRNGAGQVGIYGWAVEILLVDGTVQQLYGNVNVFR